VFDNTPTDPAAAKRQPAISPYPQGENITSGVIEERIYVKQSPAAWTTPARRERFS
jgi:hypothetical protein